MKEIRSFSLIHEFLRAPCTCRSPDGRNLARARLRKVRTPQGNAPHESEGREPRGTRTDSAAERYRRWPHASEAQARVKWWSKSPPRIRVTGRHGKPRVVQDRTGKGLPARLFPGISRILRKQGAPLRRGERNGRPASQGVDRIRLTGERHSPQPAPGRGNLPRSGTLTLRKLDSCRIPH